LLCSHRAIRDSQIALVFALGFPMAPVVRELQLRFPTRFTGRIQLARLRKEVRELRLEREILKQAAVFFAKENA